MDIVSALTVQNLTPPGYFNLSADAEASTIDYTTWWNNILKSKADDAVNLKTLILTPWLYDHPDTPRTPWLKYLTTLYGVGFFGGTNDQAAYLYRLLSSAWNLSTIYNINMILQTFCLPPFSWFTMVSPSILVGNLVSSLVDTGFLIYSTAASPATPAATAYSARAWTVPAGWTQAAASAVNYSRGYRSGGNIVWSAPRTVADFSNAYVFASSVPLAVPSAGTVAIVEDDGSGDKASVYYSDGAAWRKNSTVNADLGQVVPNGARPSPEALTVWAPDPATVTYAIDSQIVPPLTGETGGYGTFATWANNAIYTDAVVMQLTQIAGGDIAIATVIECLRRVKPLNKLFSIYISGSKYIINDVRQK